MNKEKVSKWFLEKYKNEYMENEKFRNTYAKLEKEKKYYTQETAEDLLTTFKCHKQVTCDNCKYSNLCDDIFKLIPEE